MSNHQEYSHHTSSSRSSGFGIGLIAVAIALLFLAAPVLVPAFTNIEVPRTSQVMIAGFGVFLLLIGTFVIIITRLYRKTSADEAFVRTGQGGAKIILDGGSITIPVLHNIVTVSLRTMRLNVSRSGANALITGDNLRADVDAEFYIRVQKNADAVLNAATSLGNMATNPQAVEQLVFEKLVNALRTVAATKNLEDLHTKRDEFATAVQGIVTADLTHNGLTLESVTISKLDQTPMRDLQADQNVFDARGARRITEIVTQSKVVRAQLEADGAKTVKETEVARDRAMYEQEVARASAEAERDRQVKIAQATALSAAETAAAEQQRLSRVAEVAREQAVEVAEVERAQKVAVAEQGRERAVKEAEIARLTATEVAAREQAIKIAEAEQRRAEAEQKRLVALKEQEAADQAVTTVRVTADAERTAATATIAKKAAAEQLTIGKKAEAETAAFTVTINATAEQEAAAAKAQARVAQAEADLKAKELEAQGQTAVQMVPVNVAAKQVEVDQAKVNVLKSELAAKAEFSEISSKLEVALAEIMANKEARVAMAKALGEALGKANMTMWSDPQSFSQMVSSFNGGQAAGQFLAGVGHTMPAQAQAVTLATLAGAGNLLSGVLKKLTGMDVAPAVVEAQIKSLMAAPQTEQAQPVAVVPTTGHA